jgi:RNA polymerase sigma factor (sigma-70 family)
MARDSVIPPESFDEILAWLNPDRDQAASMYLQIRADLAKIFTFNNCSDPEWMTDETFDRVAKINELRQSYEGDPRFYLYAIARNLIKEELKKVKNQASLDDFEPTAKTVAETEQEEAEQETAEIREECLRSCLKKLGAEKRKLILGYYAREKQAKIEYRAQLAKQLGTNVETLRVRAYRIRAALEECIERCIDRKAQRK